MPSTLSSSKPSASSPIYLKDTGAADIGRVFGWESKHPCPAWTDASGNIVVWSDSVLLESPARCYAISFRGIPEGSGEYNENRATAFLSIDDFRRMEGIREDSPVAMFGPFDDGLSEAWVVLGQV
jgi:hypothetical protein